MELTTEAAGRILRKLTVDYVECKHHVRGFVSLNGKRLFPIHYSFGSRALPGNIPHKFRQSLHLNMAEFALLRQCTMTKEEYFDILKEKGVIGT